MLIPLQKLKLKVIEVADEVKSTGGMVTLAKNSGAKKFLVGTDEGLIRRLIRENPSKKFYSAGSPKDIYLSLLYERYKVELPPDIIERARKSLEEMIKYI